MSTPGKGSCFKVQLMLSRVETPQLMAPLQRHIIGYKGPRKIVWVIDDEINHRRLMEDLLTPLGFVVLEARDAETCLRIISKDKSPVHCQPDILLIDVSMPGMNGLDLASTLRNTLNVTAPIVMISADAQERHTNPSTDAENTDAAYNAYMVKPIKLFNLQEQLSKLMGISWIYDDSNPSPAASFSDNRKITLPSERQKDLPKDLQIPDNPAFTELLAYAEVGYAKGFREKLKTIENMGDVDQALLSTLQQLCKQMRFDKAAELLSRKTP